MKITKNKTTDFYIVEPIPQYLEFTLFLIIRGDENYSVFSAHQLTCVKNWFELFGIKTFKGCRLFRVGGII